MDHAGASSGHHGPVGSVGTSGGTPLVTLSPPAPAARGRLVPAPPRPDRGTGRGTASCGAVQGRHGEHRVVVVQFGTEMIPGFWPSFEPSGLTSGSRAAPRAPSERARVDAEGAVRGDLRQEPAPVSAPAETNATSTPRHASTVSSRTRCSVPPKVTGSPSLRAEASGTNPSTGNARSSRIRIISRPTAPVAPITATLTSRLLRPGRTARAPRGAPARRGPCGSRTRCGSARSRSSRC